MNESKILLALDAGDNASLRAALADGEVPDVIDPEWNCTALFTAVLLGNEEGVRLLVEAGADVNAVAGEPGCDILASNVLALAQQCQFLLDHDKYRPIAEYLTAQGASGEV